MKTLLDIENYGIVLCYDEKSDFPYIMEYSDTYAPVTHRSKYKQQEEALSEIVNYILTIDNIYSFEELPDMLANAYKLAGINSGMDPKNPEITEAVYTFLYIILEGIISPKIR